MELVETCCPVRSILVAGARGNMLGQTAQYWLRKRAVTCWANMYCYKLANMSLDICGDIKRPVPLNLDQGGHVCLVCLVVLREGSPLLVDDLGQSDFHDVFLWVVLD